MIFGIPSAIALFFTFLGVVNHYLLDDSLVEKICVWVVVFCLSFMLMSAGYYAVEDFWEV